MRPTIERAEILGVGTYFARIGRKRARNVMRAFGFAGRSLPRPGYGFILSGTVALHNRGGRFSIEGTPEGIQTALGATKGEQ